MRKIATLFIGGALVLCGRAAEVADADLAAVTDKRVQDWQPTAEERRFDEIGWCHSVLEAERLAKEHKRPIFLFTHDGKMNIGRC